MDTEQLRCLRAPLMERYRDDAATALVTLQAQGELGTDVSCWVQTGRALVEERRAAADEPHREEEQPARSFVLGRQRRDDAEALGGVVQPEADDEHCRQADLASGCAAADGRS